MYHKKIASLANMQLMCAEMLIFLSRSDASSATKWEVYKATRNESSAGSEGSTKY